MIRLSLPKEPYRIELGHRVRVGVHPPSTAIAATSRAVAERRIDALRRDFGQRKSAGVTLDGPPDLNDPDTREDYAQRLVA